MPSPKIATTAFNNNMAETFTWPARVYYEDTDASGVAYHAAYLHFFERARTEWLRAIGQGQEQLRLASGIAFTVANLEIDYLRPARLDDELQITVGIEQIRGASLVFRQVISRRSQPDVPLARAKVRVGCVDAATFRACPLPANLFNKEMK
jgi:acyl-CoA thioester hydrolase